MAAVHQRQHLRLIAWVAGATCAGSLFLCSLLPDVRAGGAAVPEVLVTPGRYGPYYHLRFGLTAAAIDFANSDRAASSGGQFALRLRPEHFPVPAPSCRGSLILRMPWTAPDAPDAAGKIAAKQDLLERIWALEQDHGAVVPVVLELNPYVKVIRRSPLRLQLTQCNLFFRHAFGGYVDDTGPIPRD